MAKRSNSSQEITPAPAPMNPALIALVSSLLVQNLPASQIVLAAETELGESRETVLSALRAIVTQPPAIALD